jgi:putative transcriptional regulator
MKKALLVLALLVPVAAAAEDLERTRLLVASPELDGAYRHTALIVVPVGDDRHLGFILNRASPFKLSAIFPDFAPAAKVGAPVYYGGPEMADAIFAIVPRNPGAPAVHLFGDLYVTGDGDSIDRIIEQRPNEARFFAGFVGWDAGELADEIDAGYWYVADPEEAQVFSQEPGEAVWTELVRRVGRRIQTRLY